MRRKVRFDIYTSLYTSSHWYIRGRLLYGWRSKREFTGGYFWSLCYSLRRAISWEIKRQDMELRIGSRAFPLATDHEGYFEFLQPIDVSNLERMEIELSSNISSHRYVQSVHLDAYNDDVPLGIISDIDDTILRTKVKSFIRLKMIYYTIFVNPFRRKPIENAALFYHKKLASIKGYGPIIYLSNSPWNMYHYLKVFLEFNHFPKGELKLRDFGRQMLKKKPPLTQQNKYMEIEKLLRVFSFTNFILVGDTAEKDFDIYTTIKKKYPVRVEEIILLKTGNTKNESRIKNQIEVDKIQQIKLVDQFSELIN